MPGETLFEPLRWSDIGIMAPELVLGAWFVLLVVLDLLLPGRASRRSWIGGLTLAGLLGAGVLVLLRMIDMNGSEPAEVISLLGDSYRIDDFGSLLKLFVLAGTAVVVLLGLGTAERDSAITDKGEYFYLLLPAAMGAMMMASSGNLITLYIGLELLSITSYVLAGLRRKSLLSAEATFKYVITGGVSSAFILFGMSYLYGVTGSVQLDAIREALPAAVASYEAFVYVGFGCMLAGFAVKIAAAPFHAWSLDVYQGAPTPVAAFLAVVSKGAALAMVLRILFSTVLFAGVGGSVIGTALKDDILFAVLLVAAISMLLGTLAALRQKNVKRLLALSGVANAGYLLVPIGAGVTMTHSNNVTELIFYLVAYLLMTLGAFAVLTVVGRSVGHDELKGFAGMYYRAPWTAAAMTALVLSLAGLPVSAGFFGKLFILLGAANGKYYWIVAVMVLSSVISYYFYFGLVRQMFMRSGDGMLSERERLSVSEYESLDESGSARGRTQAESVIGELAAGVEDGGPGGQPDPAYGAGTAAADLEGRPDGTVRVPVPTGIVIWACAILTLALGIFPQPLVAVIDSVFSILTDFVPMDR
ncbi:NADH-quinone oxidoreductase subunit N [Paenibacillus soyae]|uniref:NADH-quinone oxidoreductase subunit N n=1 Tax=Paenibacillus soyae TaxID=2969249 RepID=A0A9X2MV68_9BACL|nr:NADH-quinone oxidoreductase subunit N [Paenibacillus soyae]MCR2807489.1 NADH-quinone oxidoreductase subunit N [Paenibacillus soyae]